MYKRIYFIGLLAYIFLLVLSIMFYKERIIFVDGAFAVFQIARTGSLSVGLFRFGAASVQILPVLACNMGLSLGTIIKSFSISYIFYYLACYLICGSLLKEHRFAIVILLINILFAADTFYTPTSEVPMGLVLLMVVYALIWDRAINTITPLRWGVILFTLMLVAFFHPLMLFALGFSLCFFILSNMQGKDNKVLYRIAVSFAIMLICKFIFFRTAYERHSLSGLKNVFRLFPDYFDTYSNLNFLKNCVSEYYWIPIIFVSLIVLYKKLALLIVAVFGYLILVNVMYPSVETPLFYIENLYLPLGLFLGLPFVFDLLPVIVKYKLGIPVMLLIVLTGCVRIYNAHTLYTNRLVLERKYLDEYGDKKVIIRAKKSDQDQLLMLWGTPYEFLLLSEVERNRPASIIIDEDPAHRPWIVEQKKFLVVNYNIYPYDQLDPRYFQFTDTTSGYTIIK